MAQSFDVVVVGGGIAGLVAGARAAELGKSVAVLEKGSEREYACNSRFTGGTFHVCYNDVNLAEDSLTEVLSRTAKNGARGDLIQALASDGRRTVRWLQGEGVRFVKAAAAYQTWVLAPPARSGPGLHWRGRGGDVMLRTLEANLTGRGGFLIRSARARSLAMREGRCVGVRADIDGSADEFQAQAVVLADGGFQGNEEMVKATICPAPEKLRQRGAGTGVGDGINMAQAAGAAVIDLESFYGHLLSIDALRSDKLWPYPYLDRLATAALLVDGTGRRFADESRGGIFLANAVAKLADPLSALIIFDQAIWDREGRGGVVPANPHLSNEGGTLIQAGSLEELCSKLPGFGANLRATVDQHNATVAARGDAHGNAESTERQPRPALIITPPFYAAPVCAGITYTMGGIVIDGHGRVLTPSGAAIPGLYAAGTNTAGLEGGPTVSYVGGLVRSATIALRAAEDLVARG